MFRKELERSFCRWVLPGMLLCSVPSRRCDCRRHLRTDGLRRISPGHGKQREVGLAFPDRSIRVEFATLAYTRGKGPELCHYFSFSCLKSTAKLLTVIFSSKWFMGQHLPSRWHGAAWVFLHLLLRNLLPLPMDPSPNPVQLFLTWSTIPSPLSFCLLRILWSNFPEEHACVPEGNMHFYILCVCVSV